MTTVHKNITGIIPDLFPSPTKWLYLRKRKTNNMKKIYLLGLALFSFAAVNAQDNLNLDSWADAMTPNNWSAALNDPTFVGALGDTSVVQIAGVSESAAKLKPLDLTLLGAPFALSVMSLGAEGEGVDYVGTEFAESVSFSSRFVDATGGNGEVGVYLRKWNDSTMMSDTLAQFFIQPTEGSGDWEMNTVALEKTEFYAEGVLPDTISINVGFISADIEAQGNSHYSLDEFVLNFEGSSISEAIIKTPVKVYPTVVTETATVEFETAANRTFVVLDTKGSIVKEVAVNGTSNAVNLSDLNSGAFLYRVMNGNTVVNQGKLIKK